MASEPCPIIAPKPPDAFQAMYSALRTIEAICESQREQDHAVKAVERIKKLTVAALAAVPKEAIAHGK